MLKRTITLCLLSSLIATSYCFASDVKANNNYNTKAEEETSTDDNIYIKVDACPAIAKLTDKEVKIINKDLFLDSDGNKVNPCNFHKSIAFFIVTKYDDGVNIFNNSNGQSFNVSTNSDNININFDKTKYKLTYGSNNYELEDLNDFQKNINRNDLNKIIAENPMIKSMLSDNQLSEIKSKIQIIPNNELNTKFNNYIDKEKENTLNSDLQEIINFIHENETKELKKVNDNLKDTLINQNRTILETNNIVNQYSIPNNENDNVNGNSFYLYSTSKAGYNYYLAYEDKLRDFVIDNTISLNNKLATLEKIKEEKQNITSNADNMYNKAIADWTNNSLKQKELTSLGIDSYKTETTDSKQLYSNIIKDVNAQIIHNEIDALPNKISKKQYSLLSNINKYKYAPEQEKNYINKNIFVKIDSDTIVKTKY